MALLRMDFLSSSAAMESKALRRKATSRCA
jgi:hypothetical protein